MRALLYCILLHLKMFFEGVRRNRLLLKMNVSLELDTYDQMIIVTM